MFCKWSNQWIQYTRTCVGIIYLFVAVNPDLKMYFPITFLCVFFLETVGGRGQRNIDVDMRDRLVASHTSPTGAKEQV